MTNQIPNYSDFCSAAELGNVVALSVTIPFDVETVISLADRFIDEPNFFLFESATAGPGGIARYSFLGLEALWSFKVNDDVVETVFEGHTERTDLKGRNPIKVLENYQAQFKLSVANQDKQTVDGIDLCGMGGSIGHISYECSAAMEPSIGAHPPGKLGMAPLVFFMPQSFIVHDLLSRKMTIIRYAYIENQNDQSCVKRAYDQHVAALSELMTKVLANHHVPALKLSSMPVSPDDFSASFSKSEFLGVVDECMEAICSGELFQVQVGNRLTTDCAARPFDVYRHLRILNPSPYMVFYKLDGHHIICASPEMMVNVDGERVLHRPIAGTRKRHWDKEKDLKAKKELQEDEKERAEHIMLVDLSRNDIGRIAAPGSVELDELMIVEEYSHVFHLVSQVSGFLKSGATAFDAMISSFPNGTVSGAPKVRAMQLINQLEKHAREFYAGSVGIFDFNGGLNSTILIRTIYMKGGVASTQASAGIVYDSVPDHEWKETQHKMAACLFAIKNTQSVNDDHIGG